MGTISITAYTIHPGSVVAQTAEFGALTISGAGGWKPTDADGNIENITAYLSLVSGSLGSYTPTISSGYLTFDLVGCPDGAVLRCFGASGRFYDVTVSSVPNAYSVRTATELNAASAVGTLARGTHSILLRHQVVFNPAGARVGVDWKSVGPSGSSGYVVFSGHSSEDRPQVRHISLEGNAGGPSVHYPINFDGIDFVGTVATSYVSGGGLNSSILGQNDVHGVKVSDCTFTSDITARNERIRLFHGINNVDSLTVYDSVFDYAYFCVLACNVLDFQRNTVNSFSGDAIQASLGGSVIADNFFSGNDPYFNEYILTDYTNITTGATTTFAIAGHTETIGTAPYAVIRSADGAMSAFVGGAGAIASIVNGVSITLNIDTTGLDMSSVTEVVIECATAHADFIQSGGIIAAVSGNPSFGSGYDYQIRRNIFINDNNADYSDIAQGIFLNEGTDDAVYPIGLVSHNILVGPRSRSIHLDCDAVNVVIGNVAVGDGDAIDPFIRVGKAGGEGGYAVPEASILAYNITHSIVQDNVSLTELQNLEITQGQLANYFSAPKVWPNLGPTKADVISQYTSVGSALTNLQGAAGIGRVDWNNYTDEIPPLVWASSGVNNAGNLDLSVSTTPDSTGTIYSVITTNASATFTGAEIEAGTDPDVAYATSAADSAGRQTIVYTTPTSGTYYAHSVLKRSGSYSPIDVSAGITIA